MPRNPVAGRCICYYFNHTGCTAGTQCAYMHIDVRKEGREREGRREGRRMIKAFCLLPGFHAHSNALLPSFSSSLPLCHQVDLSLITPGPFRKPVVRSPPSSTDLPSRPPFPFPLAATLLLFPLQGSHATRTICTSPPFLSVRLQPISLLFFLLLFLLTSSPSLLLVSLLLLAM